MKILITGGSGFVGRNIARILRAHGHGVSTPTHQELDLTDLKSLFNYQTTHWYDAIIHCAIKGHFGEIKHQDLVDNLKMFENLVAVDSQFIPTVIIGSGAEFDRRFPIDIMEEDQIFNAWPVDLYGLSKNIIARRTASKEIGFPYLFRLFGCFGPDEPEFRFIKRSILRLKQGLPIEIEQNKKMDFFFIDDVTQVIEYIFTNLYTHRDMNLVYFQPNDHRHLLTDVAEIICSKMNIPSNIVVKNKDMADPYTGCANRLYSTKIKLIGLEDGIQRMIDEI